MLPEKVEPATDICTRIDAAIGKLRDDYQITMYEICGGLNDHMTREMDRLVYHVRRLVEQNDKLCDRVRALEQRDDSEKASHRNRNIHNLQKGKECIHAGSSKKLAPVQRGIPRRRVHGIYRQAG